MSSTPLPNVLSPCENVRRSCRDLMNDALSFDIHRDTSTTASLPKGPRSVYIDKDALDSLAGDIAQSILDKQSCTSGCVGQKNNAPNQPTPTPTPTTRPTPSLHHHIGVSSDEPKYIPTSANDTTIPSGLDFADWDADDWHYNGRAYSRPHLSKEQEGRQRFERVALYIMLLDCINFCFWPVDDHAKRQYESVASPGQEISSGRREKNLLEYEHLAIALKKIAEQDDDDSSIRATIDDARNNNDSAFLVCAEDTYALAPQNLIHLTPSRLLEMLLPHLPSSTTEEGVYNIPNIEERCRLIVELSSSLIAFHAGSACTFISKANCSADMLVYLILSSFAGFRDTAIEGNKGRGVCFYKRAQILVADLWAALGNGQKEEQYSAKEAEDTSLPFDICQFHDIEQITTFADYRVPQLLRHLQVLQYSPSLSLKVDSCVELRPFCADELYIRAATIVTVDDLVQAVKCKLKDRLKESHSSLCGNDEYSNFICDSVHAVRLDWYLWNIGEKLDRDGALASHHLVNTLFY